MAYGKKHAEGRIISVMLKSKHNKIGIDFTFCQWHAIYPLCSD